MSANRSKLFYQDLTPAAAYDAANSFDFETGFNNLKIICATALCEFSITGPDGTKVDGKLLPGESETWNGLGVHKIAFRGAASVVRVWAW